MSERVTVLGAGSWGSIVANLLDQNGNHVTIWSRNQSQVEQLNQAHTNNKYLPNFKYSKTLVATSNLTDAIQNADSIVFAVPAQSIRLVAKKVENRLEQLKLKPNIIHVSKGLETTTSELLSQVLAEEIHIDHRKSISVISGPSQAEDVARKDITLVTAASDDINAATHAQKLFMNHYFRVYTNTDMIGVEIGAALKNIIALGAGALSGLGYGDNAKAALMVRGLAEISRLGTTFGANPLTFTGLSGVGDIIVTATSHDSRNWQAGYQLGQGKSLDQVVKNIGMVIEGIDTTKVAYRLAKKRGVEMPITTAIYYVLYGKIGIKDAISQLMLRDRKSELDN
ncbi:glycerol-3-phosphate dehydrogenase [NAD(P)+] [Philodulcilactobacillus myokoensis]|uniref:Glycerol-3-phosphate dehydrogenase [NAD(P)+] n=1 Tax=Philodulcilactobacillus myokoensis TaxID=2929573 RepID=A0A9W6ETB0_9LACO|nr:NAD(P)H-dependent glycerol-3-phosphate dehydrogenase [Philodulcilactobacillus myokoensis]GLB47138.1 glycerol-3-phosphate dehydrogenase [NAD(P)+] [Philodulcilactobacillus myokoensis]